MKLFLFIAILTTLVSCGSVLVQKYDTVSYKITGSITQADCNINGRMFINATLPVTYDVQFTDFYKLRASARHWFTSGSITIESYHNGTLVDSQTATGSTAIVASKEMWVYQD